ncbi:MAG: hypothetical protein ABSH56_10050 [Bryobacteraceae bacterium]
MGQSEGSRDEQGRDRRAAPGAQDKVDKCAQARKWNKTKDGEDNGIKNVVKSAKANVIPLDVASSSGQVLLIRNILVDSNENIKARIFRGCQEAGRLTVVPGEQEPHAFVDAFVDQKPH